MLNKQELEFLAREILGGVVVGEYEYLGKRIVGEGMNTELLREDERWNGRGSELPVCALLRQRLIEEREKNAQLMRECSCIDDLEGKIGLLQAQLAELRRKEQALLRLGAMQEG